jgi:hypothetical protein
LHKKNRENTKTKEQKPRPFDFSDVAWNRKNDFWNQKEPMTEIDYRKKKA